MKLKPWIPFHLSRLTSHTSQRLYSVYSVYNVYNCCTSCTFLCYSGRIWGLVTPLTYSTVVLWLLLVVTIILGARLEIIPFFSKGQNHTQTSFIIMSNKGRLPASGQNQTIAEFLSWSSSSSYHLIIIMHLTCSIAPHDCGPIREWSNICSGYDLIKWSVGTILVYILV